MATFTTRHGWDVTGEIVKYFTDLAGNQGLCLRIAGSGALVNYRLDSLSIPAQGSAA